MTATIIRTAPPVTRTLAWPAWLMAALAFAVAISGSGAATLNGDELATISAAQRSIGGLWELSQQIDGHFLPYYLFMHLWVKAGTAELWIRLPSAIAIGVAAWFLTDLGRRLHGTPAGITAAALFAALPSVSYYGAFARSYAFAAAAVVLAFWALLRALDEPRRTSRWIFYGGAVALICCTHLFAVLTLPAHLLLARRTTWMPMLAALAVGGLPAVALGLIGYGERHAISWIPQRGPEVLLKFPKMVADSMEVGLLLFAAALAGAAAHWFIRRDRGAWALLAWLVLPPVLLLAVSHLVTPVYVDRYLFVTAPALALLAGIAVTSVPRAPAAAAAALAVVTIVLAVPAQADVRDYNGRYADFPGAVARIKTQPGDALVYGQSSERKGVLYYARKPLPDDVLLVSREPEAHGFAFPERDDVAAALEGRRRVWMVWRGAKTAPLPRIEAVRRAGFEQASAWHSAEIPGLTVALFIRS
ncbi:glycosyltransferase family 39 protein [Nonomuraea typhae]|uniref:Glycosyltransferase family 39 protein n=1 Tax=Nonomuraea typhae TaxID=2603600 RepID=A0ABW7ZBP7_9ACTN